MSNHGDTSSSGAGKSGPPKISRPHSVCTQVVPLFGGVEMTISPGRNRNPSQRRLSVVHDR